MGSDKFRKDPLYAHGKSANHAAYVMRNDRSNKPIKDTSIGKAVVRLQKEQHHKLKGLFNTAYAIARNCRPVRYGNISIFSLKSLYCNTHKIQIYYKKAIITKLQIILFN